MKVELLEVPQEEIAKELKALKQALKQNVKLKKEQIYRDMLRVYGHLQHGGKIIIGQGNHFWDLKYVILIMPTLL